MSLTSMESDLSLIMDLQKTNFPLEKHHKKSGRSFPDARTEDAYMYEDKEGVKVFLKDGRIDIYHIHYHLV